MRCASILSSLLLLCALLPQAQAEDATLEVAATEARKQLIAEAQVAAGAEGAEGAETALEAMRRSLASDRAFAAAVQPRDPKEAERLKAFEATLAERVLLIGEHDGDGGALGAARRLARWLRGAIPCEVVLMGPTPPDADPAAYRFPPPAPREEPPAKDSPPAEGPPEAAPAKDAPGKDAPGKDAPGKDAPGKDAPGKDAPGKDAPGKEASGKDAPPADPSAKESPKASPPAPQTPEELARIWARTVREAEGPRFVHRMIHPKPCVDIEPLLRAAERQPVYVHEALRDLDRHAITGTGRFHYNLASVELRRVQAEARVERMQGDRPQPSLVDQAMVREKDAEAQSYAAGLRELATIRAGLVGTLDEMVRELEKWKTQAALLATEMDELRRRLAASEGAVPDAAQREAEHLPLRLAQARESLATLEIRLLMSTAARAARRLTLIEQLEESLSHELRWAEEVRGRYEDALLRLRTARRIDRLERDLRRLQWWRSQDAELAVAGPAAARVAADDALIALHEVALDAVRQRRAITVAVRQGAPEVGTPAAAPANGERASASDADAPPGPAGPAVGPSLASPSTASWDLKYLERARKALAEPALRASFDADLVADHYAEASAEIHRIVRAQRQVQREAVLRERFTAAATDATRALDRLQDDPLAMRVRRLPSMLGSATDDFEAALEGIATQRERNGERLAALRGYQDLLERQGTRSLLVRVDRTRQDPYLHDVLDGARTRLESAGSWASFQGDAHLGVWLQGTWPRVLLVLLAFGLAWFAARAIRGLVDRRIDKLVADLPHVSASVAEERERARARRKHADTAAAAITDDDVIRVPVEDAVATGEENPDASPDRAVDDAAPADDAPADGTGDAVDDTADDDDRPGRSA